MYVRTIVMECWFWNTFPVYLTNVYIDVFQLYLVHSNFCFNYNVSGEISNIMVIDLHAQP